MIKASPWPKLLPPLAIALAVVLVAATGALWLGGGSAAGGSDGLGELIAVAQAARADARSALAGDSDAFTRLASSADDLATLRVALGTNEGASAGARSVATSSAWNTLQGELTKLGSAREMLLELHAARERLLE